MKQFIDPEFCLKCDVCCRFLDAETPLAPLIGGKEAGLIACGERFICPNFSISNNNCKDYDHRPTDCRIYPFVVMYDETYKDVLLSVDPKCPHAPEDGYKEALRYFNTELKDIDPSYISRFQDDVRIIGELAALKKKISEGKPVLRKLLIGDKGLFDKYARRPPHPLSNYSFIPNYAWTGLLDYFWSIIDDNFCLFCKTRETFFMPIPPLGQQLSKRTITACFKLMNSINTNKTFSRIEDISKEALGIFKGAGLEIKEKGYEYICSQKALAGLTGDKYKAKRALCNYFVKNYKFEYRKFRDEDKRACLDLFETWSAQREASFEEDDYYKILICDSRSAHKKAIERYEDLGLIGRVVVVDGKISAYTFGYPLNDETFAILFEIADLRIKGLAQYIFREFCVELGNFKYINLMDDSGLENLRVVKMSYHPVSVERTYIAHA